MSRVWTEIDCDTQLAIRIFKNFKLMLIAMPYAEDGCTRRMERREAVKQIRDAVFAQQNMKCANCSAPATELHEKQHKGQFAKQDVNNSMEVEKSGEVSLANSEGLCWSCHHQGKHGDRQPRLKKV